MSVRISQGESGVTEAQRVAEHTSARDYFLGEEEKAIEEWAERAKKIFEFTGDVLKSEYEMKSEVLVEKYSHEFEELYNQSRKEFEAYCILNRKVQKKGDQIENFAAFFNSKNHKKTFFGAWRDLTHQNAQLRKMQQRAEKYKNSRTLKTCMKQWLSITMKSNRNKIKNDVLQKTELQISKIQTDYEKLIKTLEQALEKKLVELKKEEEEHKLLHDKYEAMCGRAKMENI